MTTIIANRGPYTLSQTWYVDGDPTPVGTVTIGVVDAAGDTIVAAGTATTNVGSGVYTYQLADQTALNLLTVTWTRSDTGADLVDTLRVDGGELFTEAELRAHYGGQFASTTAFTDAKIAAARDRITEEFADICGVSFVPRYERQRLAGAGGYGLWVKWPKIRTVQSATIGGVAQTVANIIPDPALPLLHHTTQTWTAPVGVADPLNVYVDYEHGWTTPPAAIKRAALVLCRHQLQSDAKGGGLGDAAITITDQFGNMNLLDDGSGATFGLRTVRDALNRYSLQARGFM